MVKSINTILLIDDNESDNLLNKYYIDKSQVCENVVVIDDALKALDYLSNPTNQMSNSRYLRPDLIFLDINMPKMNGFEFLEEYTKLDSNLKSNAVVIMLSTSLNPADVETALSFKEVVDFKNKPLTVEDIKDIVDRFFSAKQMA